MLNETKTIWMIVLSVFIMIGCGDDATKSGGSGSGGAGSEVDSRVGSEVDDGAGREVACTNIRGTAIADVDGLKAIGTNADSLSKDYTLKYSITLTEDWEPIGTHTTPFTGNFYGCDKTISGLNINKTTDDIGLFGQIGVTPAIATDTKLVIENLTIEVTKISGKQYVGALAGSAINTNITNVHITGGTVGGEGTTTIGGLIGFASSSTINNSYATGSITVTGSSVGGLVGSAVKGSKIDNSYATGAVTSKGDVVGGLVGIADKSIIITNSYATGKVTGGDGKNNIGGFIGEAQDEITITNSYFDTVGTGQLATNAVGNITSHTGVTGITEASITTKTVLSGWDFDAIWTFVAGKWPTLKQ